MRQDTNEARVDCANDALQALVTGDPEDVFEELGVKSVPCGEVKLVCANCNATTVVNMGRAVTRISTTEVVSACARLCSEPDSTQRGVA